jgi:dihydrofolate reductase
VTQASAEYLRVAWANIGASVIGRRLFDLTNGWNGNPPVADAEFVVTHEAPADWNHPDAPFTFVTDGVPSAVAQARAFAGGKDISVSPGNVGGQALAAGLVDEVRVDLVPVVFGAGVRFSATTPGRLCSWTTRRSFRPNGSPACATADSVTLPRPISDAATRPVAR